MEVYRKYLFDDDMTYSKCEIEDEEGNSEDGGNGGGGGEASGDDTCTVQGGNGGSGSTAVGEGDDAEAAQQDPLTGTTLKEAPL